MTRQCLNDIITRNKYIILFIVLYSLFNLLLLNKFYPITECWFQDYARYMLQGQFPYRDFYVPVPPGFLYLNEILRYFFGDVFLYYRIYGLLERLVLVTIVYFIFKRLYSDKLLFISILTGSVIYIANLQDLFYGYYQSSLLFSVFELYAIIKMYENYDSKKLFIWSLVFGFCSAVSFLFKQTIGGVLPVILGSVFGLLTIRRDWRKTVVCGSLSFLTALSVLGVAAYFFSLNDALIPCLEQIFLGAKSKGDLSNVVFLFIPRMIIKGWKALLAGIVLFLCYNSYSRISSRIWKRVLVFFTKLLELGIIFDIFISFRHIDFQKGNILAFLFSVLCIIAVFVISYFYVRDNNRTQPVMLLVGFYFAGLFVILQSTTGVFDYMRVFNKRQTLLYLLFFINVIWLVYDLYHLFFSELQHRQSIRLIILSASFGIMYAHGLSNIVEDHGSLLIVTLSICEVLSAKIDMKSFIKPEIVSLCILMVFCIFDQRCNLPYYWWGVNALKPIRESQYEYKDPILFGLTGDKESVNEMDRAYDLINSIKQDGDTMYTFPHINYFNLMSGLNSPTFAKVHYFDVCPDYMIDRDLAVLRSCPPKFVLIQNFEEWAWKVHEDLFRGGKPSAQRKIIEYYQLQLKNKKYKLLDEFKIGNSDKIIVLIRDF